MLSSSSLMEASGSFIITQNFSDTLSKKESVGYGVCIL